MKDQDLRQLFIEELEDMYSCEHQIINALPEMIKLASLADLKDAFKSHLEETKHQAKRLERIFSLMKLKPEEKTCEATKGLVKEAHDLAKDRVPSATLDAALISAAQKIEHYEIASYGTLRSFAKHLSLEGEILDLLQETLDEEGNANKKLTKLADGTLFSSGINQEAAEGEKTHSNKR